MGQIIAIHSYRGGTGKSNFTANLGAQLSLLGYRVGLVDTDIQSPGIHVLFGITDKSLDKSLNDYLWGQTGVEEICYPVGQFAIGENRAFLKDLSLWLIPSSMRPDEITRVIQEGYNVALLHQGFHRLIESLHLDFLLIDTHPGLHEETLLSMAISHQIILLLRPDQQDFQGTAVTIDIARRLEVSRLSLVVNKALSRFNFMQIKHDIEEIYHVPVLGVLPLSEDVVLNASDNLFSIVQTGHLWSKTMRDIATLLTNSTK